jgi:DNA polymerase-3 subunit delta
LTQKPVIYLLHGDDDYAMNQFIAEIEAKMGDPATAAMNITRLEGRSLNPDELMRSAGAMPFLTERRLVVVNNPLAGLQSQPARERFKKLLEQIPPSTALVLCIPRPLVDPRGKRSGTQHWLQKWSATQPGRVYEREFSIPHGPQMARWIQTQARELGGEFALQGANRLAELVGDDPRVATKEIEKLLAYVNYKRPVDDDDVTMLVADVSEGDVFAMVDALGNRDGRQALEMLHRLLEQDEPLRLYGMIIRQFRLLLQTRELIDSGYREADIAKKLGTHPFVISKLSGQVRNFNLAQLESIYRVLLDLDIAMKTGLTDPVIGLDVLVASLTR